ncbi:hypothetical protein [Sphingomonas limnosediminicola]|uniref:hypothetical protein n=1 Tax=Sphingomonas limnosediminicola TaxID=940133 RepID=UPI0031DAADDD
MSDRENWRISRHYFGNVLAPLMVRISLSDRQVLAEGGTSGFGAGLRKSGR